MKTTTPTGQTEMTHAEVIETREVERDYGFTGVEAIVDHPEMGRLYLQDAFGGQGDSLTGGAVRWEHGLVCKLQPGDTLDTLDGGWNDHSPALNAMIHGYDPDRPVLGWSGLVVARFAQSCGL